MKAGKKKKKDTKEDGEEKKLRNCNYTNCKCISALFIAMYDIYPYYLYEYVCVSVLDANVSRRTRKEKQHHQQRLMT